MAEEREATFDTTAFLTSAGEGRNIVHYKANQVVFPQGGAADAVYFLLTGRAKLTVISEWGKEATITLLAAGDFAGEESIAVSGGLRIATATAIIGCAALRIDREEMLRVLREEGAFSDFFLKFMLIRSMRSQADLVDQLFNSCEHRLARILLSMANFSESSEPAPLIPVVTRKTLARMSGATPAQVTRYMSRFRALGYIENHGRIRVHRSLLVALLEDRLSEQNASRPALFAPPSPPARRNKHA